jgi:hypothetical protein
MRRYVPRELTEPEAAVEGWQRRERLAEPRAVGFCPLCIHRGERVLGRWTCGREMAVRDGWCKGFRLEGV